MGRSLVAVLLTCFACRIVNAAESSLFGVPESLQIRIEGPRTYHFNWTFTRPRERPKEGPSSITVHVDTGDRTKTYTVEVSESFRLVSLSEADKDFVVDLKGVFDWLDGAKYVTTFRTLDEHQTSTPITQVVLKQKIPGRYEIYCDSSERDVLQKYVVENCVTECSSTELDSTDSHVFFVPVQSNFSVGLRASYGYPHQSRDPHGLGPPCDTNLKGIPGKVENVTRAEHMEDKLYIEWEAPEGSDNPLYEVSITSEAETTPGISFLTNSTALHVFAPILLGPAFLASMRALYLDVHGRRCYGPFTEFSIPKYYPPVPSGIEILERKPNFVRFFIMTSKPEAVKSFKISIISPSTMKSFYLNSQTGTFRDLKPYTRVLFDVQQCYVQWESPIEVCGDPLRAEVMSNVGKPSQVKVHPLRHSNGRTYIDWDAPEETNGPLAGYKVFVEGENEWGFVVPYVKTLGPDVHSYPYDQKQIMNPHRYAVTAFTVDLNHGLDIYEELIWHTPDAIIYMRMIGAGLLAAIVLLGIIIYIKLTCFDTPTHFDVVAYQEELELNFTRVQREWRQVQVRQQAPRASSRRSVAVEPDRVAAAVVEPEELETPSPEYYYTTDESDDSVSFEGGQQETNRPRWHTARTS